MGLKDSNSLTTFFLPDNFKTVRRRQVYWFCGFWFFIAILEFGQDYISAILNGNAFIVVESLSYKLFWLLFIPLSLALNYSFTKADKFFPGLQPFVFKLILILFITSIHLILFSFILFGISNLIHEDPVTLMYLIYEKLSTRLYLALSIYFSLSVFSFVIRRIKPQGKADQKIASKTITVKNGKSSKIVDIVDIKWIASDGAYLDIHTTDKKYIVLDSLKNIIKTLPENFKRIHRSTIVNMDNIKELKSRGNGDYDVIMDDDRLLRLSRNYRKQLKGDLL